MCEDALEEFVVPFGRLKRFERAALILGRQLEGTVVTDAAGQEVDVDAHDLFPTVAQHVISFGGHFSDDRRLRAARDRR